MQKLIRRHHITGGGTTHFLRARKWASSYKWLLTSLQENVNILSHASLTSLSSASTKLFLNLLIQFYLNNVRNNHQLTSHSTTWCRTTWRSYRDHRLLWRHFIVFIVYSGVARIWCQDGHMQKLLGFYRRQLSTYSRCQTLYRSKCTEKIKLL